MNSQKYFEELNKKLDSMTDEELTKLVDEACKSLKVIKFKGKVGKVLRAYNRLD